MSTAMAEAVPLFAEPSVDVERRPDGVLVLHCREPLRPCDRCVGEWLVRWAKEAPDRDFLAERGPDGQWQRVTYGEALRRVEAIGTWIIGQRLSAERPFAVLSDNSIEHALLALAAMHVGAPIASVSPAYSLVSQDHAKLKAIIGLLDPGAIYVSGARAFAPALRAIKGRHEAIVVVGGPERFAPADCGHSVPFGALEERADGAVVARAFAAVGPDTIAKFLLTSGSTGDPKAVINTQRMLTASQQAKAQDWPSLEAAPPVIVDWLPWSHTYGANHNFGLVLRNGGTLYIDGGKAAPGLFDTTLANLREVAPTHYFNVPRGFDMLIAAMKQDDDLRRKFYSRLEVIMYAAAALPQSTWNELIRLSHEACGRIVPMLSAWGSTETSPLAAECYWQADISGVIGLPVPGIELKLVPGGGKLEARLRGPNVTPGYWKREDLTKAAFDEDGFYKIGDALRFVDPERPVAGLLFDGRVSEDFKLTSGSWVSVGKLRIRGIDALAPLAQDIVVTGHDRDFVGFLVFPNLPACRAVAGLGADAAAAQVLVHPKVVAGVAAGLAKLEAEGGGATLHAARALLLAEPPNVDAGEITDKAYINQRAVITRRAALVERLHAKAVGDGVIAV
jgi:feruloyl-CoA synthase